METTWLKIYILIYFSFCFFFELKAFVWQSCYISYFEYIVEVCNWLYLRPVEAIAIEWIIMHSVNFALEH